MRHILCFVATLGLASGALAQTAEVPAKPVKEKKVCKRLDKTGSILGERTCMTKSEWEAFAAANAANADKLSRERASQGTNKSNGGQ